MLDYPEYDVSLATGVQDLQAIKPNYMAIKKSDMAQARRLGVGGGGGGSGCSDETPHCLERSARWPLTNNLTGLKHVSHV